MTRRRQNRRNSSDRIENDKHGKKKLEKFVYHSFSIHNRRLWLKKNAQDIATQAAPTKGIAAQTTGTNTTERSLTAKDTKRYKLNSILQSTPFSVFSCLKKSGYLCNKPSISVSSIPK